MAIAGGAGTTYLVQRSGGSFTLMRRTALRDLCEEPDIAWERFVDGHQVRIDGQHVEAFLKRCKAWVGNEPTIVP